MTDDPLSECTFLIALRRDRRLSDGELHATTAWNWLHSELWVLAGAVRFSRAPEEGDWADKTGERVYDLSRKYTIAVQKEKVDELRSLLRKACIVFCQECVYFSVKGEVEFVYPPPGTWPQLTSE